MSGSPVTDEDVREQLNAVETALARANSDDEFMAAMLRNQQLLFNVIGQSLGSFDIGNLPMKSAGLAVEDMAVGEPGRAVFDLNGTKKVATVTPTSEVKRNDVVYINGPDNEVTAANSIDEGQLLGIGIDNGTKTAAAIEKKVTRDPVTLEPGEVATLLKVESETGGSWNQVGSNDATYTEYAYFVDGESIFDEPQFEPLGLYNDLYSFPQALKFSGTIEVRAQRQADAPGPEDYFSKVVYYE